MADNGNFLQGLAGAFEHGMEEKMKEAGDEICWRMADKLMTAHHVDTGALIESIDSETVNEGNGKITTYIYANADNEGTQYAEFIEEGTGAAHGREGGRVGYWRYQDRNGIWRTTDGMDADPFIRPSVEEWLPELGDLVNDVVYDIDKYGK